VKITLKLERQPEDKVTRSNSTGRAEVARSALRHFQRARPMHLESPHLDREPPERALQQFIDNQRIIIRAAEGNPDESGGSRPAEDTRGNCGGSDPADAIPYR